MALVSKMKKLYEVSYSKDKQMPLSAFVRNSTMPCVSVAMAIYPCSLEPTLHQTLSSFHVECGKLQSPRFGRMDTQVGNDGDSEIATFNCARGYYLVGSSAVQCEDGAWNGKEPKCERMYLVLADVNVCTLVLKLTNVNV